MNKKHIRLLILVSMLVFLFLTRTVLSPFLLAAVVAYVLTPLVDLIHRRLKIPRVVSVLAVYLLLLIFVSYSLVFVLGRLFEEVKDFRQEYFGLVYDIKNKLSSFPDWLQLLVYDGVKSLENATSAIPTKILPFFSGAVSQIINVLIFLAATFYFINDYSKISRWIKNFVSESSSDERIGEVFDKVSNAFSSFLRGQLILIILMSSLTSFFLALLGVKFFLLLGVFTGFAEIIPIVGPIVATIVASVVAVLDGPRIFGLDPIGEILIVIVLYFILRQMEDIIVIPHVMGKVAKVHPLLVMFAVIAGGHIAGIWGLFLAVPVLAVLRIVYEYYW